MRATIVTIAFILAAAASAIAASSAKDILSRVSWGDAAGIELADGVDISGRKYADLAGSHAVCGGNLRLVPQLGNQSALVCDRCYLRIMVVDTDLATSNDLAARMLKDGVN